MSEAQIWVLVSLNREVRRVALDFKWPLGRKWKGFVNPFEHCSTDCPVCGGSGDSPQVRYLKDRWHGNVPFSPGERGSQPFQFTDAAVVAFARSNVERAPEILGSGRDAIEREAQRLATHFNRCWSHHLNDADVAALLAKGGLLEFTHTCKAGEGWKLKDPPYIPTAAEVNLWSITGFGHGGAHQSICVRAECKRLGFEEKCPRCDGEGTLWPSAEIKRRAKDFMPTPPPAGEGWQIWETVSEGSPVTRVFATREELIEHLVEGGDAQDRKGGRGGWSREYAERVVGLKTTACLCGAPGVECPVHPPIGLVPG
jgi:hypothetical protein